MAKKLLLFVLGPVTLIGVLAFLPPPADAFECFQCHYCEWDHNLAEAGGGVSSLETEMDVFEPPVCFFWSFCQGCSEAPEADLAFSSLLNDGDVELSEWIKVNSSLFRFRVVDGSLEIVSENCGDVLTWIPLDDPEEAGRVRAIISQE